MAAVTNILNKYPKSLFLIWCLIASFGAYFCMYAFRKPFITGTYANLYLWGIEYKVILIIAQVLGYMLSKFIGIKVIAELRSNVRIRLILGLIIAAELALLGFALTPHPYNFIFLFLNGLPLGMVWGVVFSFLEGRRFTEVLVFGLSISVIVASGCLKTIYLKVQEILPSVTEFWMPFVVGAIFMPLFILFVWMLSQISPPTAIDKKLRTERVPMDNDMKKAALKFFGPALICLIVIYALLTAMRDFRDNFSVEIWNVIDPAWEKGVLSQTELMTGVVILTLIGLISLIKNNAYGFWATMLLIFVGLATCGISTLLYEAGALSPFLWTFCTGTGLFMAYIPVQTIFFDRMLAVFRHKGNAGFFVYLCDSVGYLGSVVLLLYKELFFGSLNWSQLLIYFSYGVSIVGTLLFLTAAFLFRRMYHTQRKTVWQPTDTAVTLNFSK